MSSFNPLSCVHYKNCSGCQLDLTASLPRIWKECCDYFSIHNLFSPQFYQGSPLHWRNRAKLAVRGTYDDARIGLFKANSHTVIPIPFCNIHDPAINQTVDYIKTLIKQFRIDPYDEELHSGELRYLQLVVERSTGKVQITFVLNQKELTQKWQPVLTAIETEFSLCHSVWINFNPRKTNTIFGDRWLHCFGPERLWESFLGTKVCFHPASFAQANLNLFEKMISHIKPLIAPDSKIVEYYAGVGAVGLPLAPFCQSLSCVEINPYAEACFLESKELIPTKTDRISFFTGPSEDFLHLLEYSDTVIVDPPRKGLCKSVLHALKEASTVRQFIYISCGWESFKRDCDALLASGWSLQSAAGYWFFPGTNQVEILAHLQRK